MCCRVCCSVGRVCCGVAGVCCRVCCRCCSEGETLVELFALIGTTFVAGCVAVSEECVLVSRQGVVRCVAGFAVTFRSLSSDFFSQVSTCVAGCVAVSEGRVAVSCRCGVGCGVGCVRGVAVRVRRSSCYCFRGRTCVAVSEGCGAVSRRVVQRVL